MQLFILQFLIVSTAVIAWIALSINGYALFWYRKKDKKFVFMMSVILLLWIVTSFNTWYEGLFIFERIALLSTLNSWAFTLITPLLYLCYRFCTTGCYSGKLQWMGHLLIPGVLLGVYVGMTLYSPVSDKLIYSWRELAYNSRSWWVLFRLSCYLLLGVQLSIYLTRLPIKREIWFILYLYLISILCLLTSSVVCNVLYNLSLLGLGVWLFKQSVLYWLLRRKLKSYLSLDFIDRRVVTPAVAEKQSVSFFSSEQEELAKQLLTSSEFLHNPELKISVFARALSTNITYTSLYFKRKLGLSFKQYITSCRLDEAEKLLRQTDRSIIEISESVGFRNYSTFYTAFKTRHNVSPIQWKNERKAEALQYPAYDADTGNHN